MGRVAWGAFIDPWLVGEEELVLMAGFQIAGAVGDENRIELALCVYTESGCTRQIGIHHIEGEPKWHPFLVKVCCVDTVPIHCSCSIDACSEIKLQLAHVEKPVLLAGRRRVLVREWLPSIGWSE